MARYQRNRRNPAPASIAGRATAQFSITEGAVGAGVAEVLLAAIRAEIPNGDTNPPTIPLSPPETIMLDPAHWNKWSGTANETAITATLTTSGVVETTYPTPPVAGDQIIYNGRDAAFNSAVGNRIAPALTVVS